VAYQFSPEVEQKFQWLLTRYPKKDAVLIPLLHLVQAEVGFLSPDAIDYVASRMQLSPARVREVASFYSIFRFDKKGRYVLQVCHTMSCHLRGSDDLIARLKTALGISEGETTPDGLFTLERVECLASCGTAPVMQVNDWDFHEELNFDKLDKVIEALKQNRWANASFAQRVAEGAPT
jgi:NADH-quinone oxidoreductase subunit E